ncbi:hypothetical protein [Cysteiniphilum litorale]|uniref:hypothetical protein n=1 Tax=Cysteiniphilum litorale TaxID=2056700 RepID=UPI003F885236
MKAYSTTEFRSHLAEALKIAQTDGVVKIYNKRGDEFTLTPLKRSTSPFLNVNTISLKKLDNNEILAAIHDGRERR